MIELRICAGGPVVAAESWGLPGPTALLVHGWSGSAADMQMMAMRLVQAGWRAVALDLPAHGRSSGRHTSLPEMIAAIAAVASALGPIDALIAHSLGATAVTLALSQDRLQTRAAVLLSPAAGPEYFLDAIVAPWGFPPGLSPA